jgi:hypothetical protein
MQYQGDSNVVVCTTNSPSGTVAVWASGRTVASCGSPSLCRMYFQSDGNLVAYYNGNPQVEHWHGRQGGEDGVYR